MTNAIDKIQEEHKDLGRVLQALRAEVKKLRGAERRRAAGQEPEGKPGHRPNLDLLFSIVYYIRVFPDKFHHPKEEDYLFRALRQRNPGSSGFLDQVIQQHSVGARLIDELDAALKAYHNDYPEGLDALEAAAETFVTSQFDHMKLEEEKIIPAARDTLTSEDWDMINRVFSDNRDPMFSENVETAFHALHDHIVKGAGTA